MSTRPDLAVVALPSLGSWTRAPHACFADYTRAIRARCAAAMKRNPITGEMEVFKSEKLKDDLPEEEAEEGEIEIPVGDDY